MSRIVEGSLEIRQPIAAMLLEEDGGGGGDGDASTLLVSSPVQQDDDQFDDDKQKLQQQHADEEEESRTYGEESEEKGGCSGKDDSFTDEASGPDEDEDESVIAERGERATITFNTTKELNEAKWQYKLELLRQYRERNGHCRVPLRYEIDGVELGKWVAYQRACYKKHCEGKKPSCITQERIDELTAVGLDFKDTQQKRNEAQWQSKLELLRQYQEQHGHCNVPTIYEINGVKLGIWLKDQRKKYKMHSGGKPGISQEHINALNAIGLEWLPRKFMNGKESRRSSRRTWEESRRSSRRTRAIDRYSGATPSARSAKIPWQSMVKLLRKYRKQHGHCRVPNSYEIDGVKLGRWLSELRTLYKKHSEGKPAKGKISQITEDRIDQLTAIGVDFNYTQQQRREAQWQSKLELLRQYQEQHGQCYYVPISYEIDGVKLGSWISGQRRASKKFLKGESAPITQERINALNAIGLNRLPGKSENGEDETASEVKLAPSAAKTPRSSKRKRSVSIERHSVSIARAVSTNTVPEIRSSPRLSSGKRKRKTPDRFGPDPPRNQATVTNQSPAKVKASHGKNSRSVTPRSSKRTVSEHPQSENNTGVESTATATTDMSWEEHFDRLVEFKWNHGHCHVPVDLCVDDSYYLGQWVVVQRLQHNRLEDGRPSSITAEQVERLNSIGFLWKVR